MMDSDIKSCLESVDWCRADYEYFRGGGFSSHFKTMAEMPVTMLRINLVDGVGPTIQIAEGYTVVIDEEIHKILKCYSFDEDLDEYIRWKEEYNKINKQKYQKI